VASRVVDWVPPGIEDEDEPLEGPIDRSEWARRSSAVTLTIVDRMLELVRRVEPELQLKYNKRYVGLANNGTPRNFAIFLPKQHDVIVEIKIPQADGTTKDIEDAGLDLLQYSLRSNRYRIRLQSDDVEKHSDLLANLMRQASEEYGE
jgi:hypothetical protein